MLYYVNQSPYCFDCSHLVCKDLQAAGVIFLIELDLWTQETACLDIYCLRCGALLLSADERLARLCDDVELIN